MILRYKISAFTLLELMVVVVILGITVALTIPGYRQVKDRALLKEANIGLNLIESAEKIYGLRHDGRYVGCNSNKECNTTLNINLPTDSPNWNYIVTCNDPFTTWTAEATRADGTDVNPRLQRSGGQEQDLGGEAIPVP